MLRFVEGLDLPHRQLCWATSNVILSAFPERSGVARELGLA